MNNTSTEFKKYAERYIALYKSNTIDKIIFVIFQVIVREIEKEYNLLALNISGALQINDYIINNEQYLQYIIDSLNKFDNEEINREILKFKEELKQMFIILFNDDIETINIIKLFHKRFYFHKQFVPIFNDWKKDEQKYYIDIKLFIEIFDIDIRDMCDYWDIYNHEKLDINYNNSKHLANCGNYYNILIHKMKHDHNMAKKIINTYNKIHNIELYNYNILFLFIQVSYIWFEENQTKYWDGFKKDFNIALEDNINQLCYDNRMNYSVIHNTFNVNAYLKYLQYLYYNIPKLSDETYDLHYQYYDMLFNNNYNHNSNNINFIKLVLMMKLYVIYVVDNKINTDRNLLLTIEIRKILNNISFYNNMSFHDLQCTINLIKDIETLQLILSKIKLNENNINNKL